MSVFNDIKDLRRHYKNQLNWYFTAIEKIEADIQDLWGEYFAVKKPTQSKMMKLLEIENSFQILRSGIDHFRNCVATTEKRLDDLKREEDALMSKGDRPVN